MRAPQSIFAISLPILLLGTPPAQTRPDFSGRWVSVTAQPADVQSLEVKQDAVTLTEARGEGGESHTMTYKLDGTENRMAVPSHDAEIVFVTSAKWEGASLVLTNAVTYPAGNKVTIRQVWSLGGDNQQLVTEMTRLRETDGTTPPKPTRVVYRRR